VLIAVIVALVIVQIAVIGVVLNGRLDQRLTLDRMDAGKAQFACDSGIEMALRELYDGADEDGDGIVGGISDDSNSATGIIVNGCKVSVHRSDAAGVITLTATAVGTSASRSIQVTLQ
jgi:hypothetical protein